MKTDLTTYGSLLQSRQLAQPAGRPVGVAKNDAKLIDPKLLKEASKPAPDYKLDLSKPAVPSPSLPGLPDLPSANISKPKIPESDVKKPEIKKPDIKKPDVELTNEVKAGTLKNPAIIFIKGLDIFSSPSTSESGYAGVGKMAEAIEGSRIYGWDQQDEIIKEIKKVHVNQPVILVGHSFGGDTAVEIAEELDSLEHGFRKIDLLITMDAVGADNDIIPQNVKNHLNVFGESNFLLNDGPHVARRNEMTKVKNILSPYDHTELDDNKEIQYEVVTLIKDTLSRPS